MHIDSVRSLAYNTVMNERGDYPWTIEELGGKVAEALAAGGYDGVASGRVRDVPDARTIRYYATIGVLDRPGAFRGRTALYGPRHLRQLLAIKRLQADGHSLGEIQRKVAGATDRVLDRFHARSDAEGSEAPPAPRRKEAGRGAFWKERPTPPPAPALPSFRETVVSLQGVGLGPEATLLLQALRPPNEDDLRVIRLAAAPLLELLRMRGLIDSDGQERPGALFSPEEDS